MRFIIILLISLPVHASWYCNQVASEWSNDHTSLATCGVGYGKNEDEARTAAFESAKKEFNQVCGKETTCANKVVNIEPQRSDCQPDKDGWSCRRLFNFNVTSEYRTPESLPVIATPAAPTKSVVEHNYFNNNYTIIQNPTKVIQKDGSEYKFKRFVRSAGPVKIYETNYRGHQGIVLTNPSDSDLEAAIKRASRSGSMNHIYILTN